MGAIKYLVNFLIVYSGWLAVTRGGWQSFSLPIIAFGLFPILELLFQGATSNLDPAKEKSLGDSPFYDLAIYVILPCHFGILGFYLYKVSHGAFDAVGLWGATYSVGLMCGVFGINVAHELGHRKKVYEQNMSKALLLTAMYVHFFIEHNRGHHARVSTPDDPATARRGESLYAFWVRSVRDSYISAWRLENERLIKTGRRPFSLQNQMLRLQLLQAAFVAGIFAVFGPLATAFFLICAVIGFLLLETVNYIEHYGLMRRKLETGRYEKTSPEHSWNSNHPIGRAFLYELSRHSDHHANPNRKYQLLRHLDPSPQMPTGYPGMMWAALIPPLWFRIMHPRIDRLQSGAACAPEAPASPGAAPLPA